MQAQPSLHVKGIDLLGLEFGCVLALELPVSVTHRELVQYAVKSLGLPTRYANRCLPLPAWEADVAFHATKASQPGTVARYDMSFQWPLLTHLQGTHHFVGV